MALLLGAKLHIHHERETTSFACCVEVFGELTSARVNHPVIPKQGIPTEEKKTV
jgi:hypothetical protein